MSTPNKTMFVVFAKALQLHVKASCKHLLQKTLIKILPTQNKLFFYCRCEKEITKITETPPDSFQLSESFLVFKVPTKLLVHAK